MTSVKSKGDILQNVPVALLIFFFHDLQCRHFFFFLLQNIFNYFYFNRLFIFIFRNIINNIIIYFKMIFYVVIGDCVQRTMVFHVPAV